jgi:uncharacterized cupin superfamily protein
MTAEKSAETVHRPFSVEDVPWKEWSQGEHFGSRYRDLGRFGGGSHVGVSMEELAPGKQSVPQHYHMLEEEHMLILSGSATLHFGDERIPVKEGDFVCFPAGQKVGHALLNESAEPCRFLMIGEDRRDEVVVYTKTKKVLVRALGTRLRLTEPIDYWEGEEGA